MDPAESEVGGITFIICSVGYWGWIIDYFTEGNGYCIVGELLRLQALMNTYSSGSMGKPQTRPYLTVAQQLHRRRTLVALILVCPLLNVQHRTLSV